MLVLFKCPYCEREFISEKSRRGHVGQKHKNDLLDEKVRVITRYSDDFLDITRRELEELRANHSNVCDVCGKKETANTRPESKSEPNKLCVDHDHSTNQFRGFLCVQCNRNFGWYDKYKEKIHEHEAFLHRGIDL